MFALLSLASRYHMAWMERFREAGGCVFVGEDTHRDRQTVLQTQIRRLCLCPHDGSQGALCFANVRPSIRPSVCLSVRPSVRPSVASKFTIG